MRPPPRDRTIATAAGLAVAVRGGLLVGLGGPRATVRASAAQRCCRGRAEARRVPLGVGWVCGHFAFPGPGLDNPR
eukprot:206617-Prymnesium_polylepis.1